MKNRTGYRAPLAISLAVGAALVGTLGVVHAPSADAAPLTVKTKFSPVPAGCYEKDGGYYSMPQSNDPSPCTSLTPPASLKVSTKWAETQNPLDGDFTLGKGAVTAQTIRSVNVPKDIGGGNGVEIVFYSSNDPKQTELGAIRGKSGWASVNVKAIGDGGFYLLRYRQA